MGSDYLKTNFDMHSECLWYCHYGTNFHISQSYTNINCL